MYDPPKRLQDARIELRCFREEKLLLRRAARITTRKGDLGPWLLELGLREATRIVGERGPLAVKLPHKVGH